MNTTAHSLLERIQSHEALIGIIGMGYVGLPLALAFAENGFPVLGFDVDDVKIEQLDRGDCYIKHLDGGRLGPRSTPGCSRHLRLLPPPRARRGADLRPDAAHAAARARHDLRPPAPSRCGACARPARRARVDHLARHHRRAGPAHPRETVEHRRRDTQRLTLDAQRCAAGTSSSWRSRPSAKIPATPTSPPPPLPRWSAAWTRSPATSPRRCTTR